MKKIPNWYVITGGPNSGKTTTIDFLKDAGYHILPEYSRIFIDKEMARGRTIKEIRGDPKTFQENIMKLKLGLEKPLPKNKIVFLDRGLPDTIAYYKFHKLKIPPKLLSMSRNRYKKIFILDMLPYHKDYARIEDVKDAKKIHKMIMKSYKELGYKLVKIPVMPVEKRVEKILKSVKE